MCDSDGQLLLIEAAEYIPRWLTPDTSLNRVSEWAVTIQKSAIINFCIAVNFCDCMTNLTTIIFRCSFIVVMFILYQSRCHQVI